VNFLPSLRITSFYQNQLFFPPEGTEAGSINSLFCPKIFSLLPAKNFQDPNKKTWVPFPGTKAFTFFHSMITGISFPPPSIPHQSRAAVNNTFPFFSFSGVNLSLYSQPDEVASFLSIPPLPSPIEQPRPSCDRSYLPFSFPS